MPGESKQCTHLEDYGIKRMWPIFKTKISTYQSKAYLDEELCSVKSLIVKTQNLEKCL